MNHTDWYRPGPGRMSQYAHSKSTPFCGGSAPHRIRDLCRCTRPALISQIPNRYRSSQRAARGNAACSPQLPRLLVTFTVYLYYNYLYNKRGDAEGEQESVDNPQQDVDDDDAAVRGG